MIFIDFLTQMGSISKLFIIFNQLTQKMLPGFQPLYQPYFFFPTMPQTCEEFQSRNGYPFFFSNIGPQMTFTPESQAALPPQRSEPTILVHQNRKNKQKGRISGNTDEQTKEEERLRKEKLIRKLANRPSTYLTQRKFYLAQSPPDFDETGMKLRTRNKKKKVNSNFKIQEKKDQIQCAHSSSLILVPMDQSIVHEEEINWLERAYNPQEGRGQQIKGQANSDKANTQNTSSVPGPEQSQPQQ